MHLEEKQLDRILAGITLEPMSQDFLARLEREAFAQPQQQGFWAALQAQLAVLLPQQAAMGPGWRFGGAIAALMLGFYAGYHIGVTGGEEEGDSYAIEQEASVI